MTHSNGKPSVFKVEQKAILVFSGKETGDKKAVTQALYDALCTKQPYAKYLQNSDMTWEDMYAIAEHMRGIGLTWEKAYYMPIQSFCRVKSLKYILAHKEESLGNKGTEEFLKLYVYLKSCFIKAFGLV